VHCSRPARARTASQAGFCRLGLPVPACSCTLWYRMSGTRPKRCRHSESGDLDTCHDRRRSQQAGKATSRARRRLTVHSFSTVCLPLSYSGKPGVNDESHRGGAVSPSTVRVSAGERAARPSRRWVRETAPRISTSCASLITSAPCHADDANVTPHPNQLDCLTEL
jgi:hypothetical protein